MIRRVILFFRRGRVAAVRLASSASAGARPTLAVRVSHPPVCLFTVTDRCPLSNVRSQFGDALYRPIAHGAVAIGERQPGLVRSGGGAGDGQQARTESGRSEGAALSSAEQLGAHCVWDSVRR